MKDTKFYRVETLGMVFDENMELCVPNVIGKKSNFFEGKDSKCGSMPMFAYLSGDVLRDVVTDDIVKFESNFILPDGVSVSKSIKDDSLDDIVAISIKPVTVDAMFGWVFELDSEDIKRYITEVDKLKKISIRRYGVRNKVKSIREDEYLKGLMLDNINSFKNNCFLIKREMNSDFKFVKKK